MSWLTRSFDEHSIAWILISGGLGTLLGAFIKFYFDQVLGARFKAARIAGAAIRNYSLPLLESAYTLDRRIANFCRFVDRKWFEDKDDDYYRLSTLYVFGCYFGWCKILENEGFFGLDNSKRRTQKFGHQYHRVFKGMTSFEYFDLENIQEVAMDAASVPRLALTAIGELMIKDKDQAGKKPSVLGFVEFTQKYQSSEEFKKWFGYVDRLLRGITGRSQDLKWNRLLVFDCNLRVFVSFLDPQGRQTTKHLIDCLPFMDPVVAGRVRKEIADAGFGKLLEECSR